MKPNPICFTKQKFRFENEEERDFEKKRTDEIPYTNLCSLLDVTLSIRAFFFFFSLCLCSVCVIALFLYFRLTFFFFFSFLCVLPLFIEKLQRSFSLIFLSTDQIMEQFSSIFPLHFLIPCWAMTHYSAFCSFYLFRCFLNSLFLVCDIPTFPLFGPSFMKPCSLLSSVATSHLLFFN